MISKKVLVSISYLQAQIIYFLDILTRNWQERYPSSFTAHVEMEEHPHRFLGRVIKNSNGDILPVETLKDCVCIHLGSRGQTVFNYTISIPGN